MPASTPSAPPTDRAAAQARAEQHLKDLLATLDGVEGLDRLQRLGAATAEAAAVAEPARAAAVQAAMSAAFYQGAQGLHTTMATSSANWLQARRRALQVANSPFLSTASPEQVAERARELGLAEVPDALTRLPALAHAFVEAEEWLKTVRAVRDALVPQLYSASVQNPDGITQPMLAKAAGIAEPRVWQLVNPKFRAHRPRHGNRRLYPAQDGDAG